MAEKTKEPQVKQTVGDNIKDVKGDVIFERVTQIGYQTIIQGEVSFEELSLEQFESKEFLKDFNLENFKTSNLLKDLFGQVTDQHIVFLAKDRKIKKSNLARIIAYLIGKYRKSLIKESVRNSNLGLSLQSELHKSEKSSIFILSDISFRSFGVSLEVIKEVARQKQHYIICTTDESKETWQANDNIPFYENLFDEFQNYKYLVNELSEEKLIQQWYENLDPREQLLAIALSLFDNAYGDQFFAALEQLVEKVWQRRDSSLRALDYCDLRSLYAYFSFSGKSEQEETIEVTSSRERRLLLKVSWKSHRRQIINALPVLVNLVKDSVNYFNYELYGTEARRSKLRQVISEAISNIGLFANDSKVVEDILLSLAAAEDIRVQAVAAEALANWRTSEKKDFIQGTTNETTGKEQIEPDKKLFETIQRWQNEAQVSSLVNSFLKRADYEKSKEPVDYVRSTIALTVGYASELDPPDQMSEDLLKLLKILISDRNVLVQNRVFSDTLPRIVRRHTEQIRNDLKIFLLEPDFGLIIAISKSLANAYQFRPTVVLSILESWQAEAENSRPQKVPKNKVTSREILLATVAMTYGEIDFSVNNQIFGDLQKILAEEPHPFVRASAISAVGRQAQKNFRQVEPQLQTLAGQVTKDERQALADILTEIYLEQRFRLAGGDDTIKAKDRESNELLEKEYSVWLNSQRPLTEVEVAMLRWVKDDENAMAQQVATRASTGFADRFDKEEARQVEELKKKRGIQQVEMFEEYALPIQADYPPRDWYLGKLIPWLVTKSAENYRISIRNLLPEGLFQRRQSRKNINFVLHKWHDSSDSDIKIISDRLRPGILLAENLKWGMVGAVLISMGLVSVSVNQLQKIPSPESPVPIDPGITLSDRVGVSDIDSQTFDQGQLIVRFAENGTPEDRLGIRSQGRGEAYTNLSGNKILYGNEFIGQFVGGKGAEPLVVNFNSNAKTEAVQALMRNVTYHNVADSPKLGLRKVEFQVTDDAGATSNSLVRNILVAQENKAPQLKVPKNQTANENTPLRISGIGFEDSDSTKNLTIVLSVDQGTITIRDSLPKGLRAENISNNNSKEVTLTGNAEQINSTLSAPNAVTYKGSNNTDFSIEINDGGLDIPGKTDELLVWPPGSQTVKTNQGDFQITVNPANKIPRISIADAQKAVDEDEKLSIGNIVIDDPDSSKLTVVLSVEHGTLSVKSDVSQGLTRTEISANQSNRVVLSGERNKVRATLSNAQSIVYQGRENFYGSDLLKIEVNDGGRGNAGTIAINVNPVNDPPVLNVLKDIAPPEVAPSPDFPSNSSSVPPSTPAQREDLTNATITGDSSQQKNIRAEITTDAEVLFELPVGSRVRVIDSRRNSDNYLWYKIYSLQYRREGWIASHLIQLD